MVKKAAIKANSKASAKPKPIKKVAATLIPAPKPKELPPVEAIVPLTPEANPKRANKAALMNKINGQFNELAETLMTISQAKKMPRSLRWAFKTLDMARQSAERAVTHAE